MRRVVCTELGPVDQLRVEEAPDPVPAPGQVVIAVEAAGVNFVDALFVEGRYQIKPPVPFTPGSEVAGTVAELGDGVTGVSVGDRVLAMCGLGGFATHVAVPAASLVPVPPNLSAARAAALLQSYATALYALTRRITVEPGEWVLVLGAGGGVGLAAVDVAKALGAHVVAAASTAAKLAAARAMGADATVAYDDEDLKAAARDRSGGGVDVVVDPVGGDKSEPALRTLRTGGRHLVIGFAAGDIPRLPANQVLLNNRTVAGVDWGAWTFQQPEANRALIEELMGLVGRGDLHPVEPHVHPLDRVADALSDLQSRRVTGKVVLAP